MISELRLRLRILFSPAVRLHVWCHTADRRTNAQRDRDLEATWRARVLANVRRREHKDMVKRASVAIPLEPGDPIAVPATRLMCRQAR